MESAEDRYWVLLNSFPKFGPRRFTKLLNHFGSAKAASLAHGNELKNAGIEEAVVKEFQAYCQKTNIDKTIKILDKEDIKLTKITDVDYPELLKHIPDPPPLLYYKGNIKMADEVALAVIGSRKYSYYGKQTLDLMIPVLAENGIVVISGMALGIDALAHKNTLKAGGITWAVVGSGLDKNNIYPAPNRHLFYEIIESGGAVLSEFPPGTPPLKQNFPRRNRIISGLSSGVLVIEATARSGTSITCRQALEQGRDIFAIPGNIHSPSSQGTNELIKQGAYVITKPQDILDILHISPRSSKPNQNKEKEEYSPSEQEIISHLSTEPTHFNHLVRTTKLDTSTVNSTLTILEIKGIVRNVGGKKYIINKR